MMTLSYYNQDLNSVFSNTLFSGLQKSYKASCCEVSVLLMMLEKGVGIGDSAIKNIYQRVVNGVTNNVDCD